MAERYKFRSGYSFPVDPNTINEELERIKKKYDGIAPPEAVIEESMPKDAKLHECFTWDNKRAGHLYRIEEAREITRSIELVKADPETGEESRQGPAWLSVASSRGGEAGYMPVMEILSNEELAQNAVNDAYAQFVGLRNRYQKLTQLSKIFKAIDSFKLPD